MFADSGMEWVKCNGTKTTCSVRKARSQAPMGAAQCRDAGSNSARVWAGGDITITLSAVCGGGPVGVLCWRLARRRRWSGAGGRHEAGIQASRAAASSAKPVRVAANFLCRHRAPKDLKPTGRVDCNRGLGAPRRVQRARCSERAADRGLLTPVKAARCRRVRACEHRRHERRHTRAASDLLTGKPLAGCARSWFQTPERATPTGCSGARTIVALSVAN